MEKFQEKENEGEECHLIELGRSDQLTQSGKDYQLKGSTTSISSSLRPQTNVQGEKEGSKVEGLGFFSWGREDGYGDRDGDGERKKKVGLRFYGLVLLIESDALPRMLDQ